MSSSTPRIFEGVFAIRKPPHISSAQVVRNLQDAFLPSTLFATLVEEQKRLRDQENRFQKRRRRDNTIRLKIGHGGTLDPLATGVLVIGIGRGTKHLQTLLGCTKSYTTEVLFGAATDTYDILGKVLSKAPHDHVTKEKVENALEQFRGEGMQTPPIYSALNQDGKRLYEYAREGKEPPRAIQPRPVTVQRLEMVEWLGEGHDFRWPNEVAPEAERKVAEKVLGMTGVAEQQHKVVQAPELADDGEEDTTAGEKRKREEEPDPEDHAPPKKRHQVSDEGLPEAEQAAANDTAQDGAHQEEEARIPPAVKLDMTVTSGFYVRSLCHDLGKAVGSQGLMATLVRTRQGDYILGHNVLEHDDLAKGEEVWGPKVRAMLETWLEKNSAECQTEKPRRDVQNGPGADHRRRRRNSSSELDD